MSYQMYIPTRIIFGNGCLNQLRSEIMPGMKPLVVISNGKSVRENGALDTVLEVLIKE